MGLLTEADLRLRLRAEELDSLEEYRVEAGTIVTPSARAFLSDHRINLVVGGDGGSRGAKPPRDRETDDPPTAANNGNLPEFVAPKRYETVTGAYYDEKPEHMTAIRGPKLVNKDHPVIRFRGLVDSLEAAILEAQLRTQRLGMAGLTEDLGEVLRYVGEILRCEVLGIPLEERPLLGMDSDELRTRSHRPQKFYGLHHFAASLEHGEAVIALNSLRTRVREVELAAYNAFKDIYGVPERPDLIKALNRLSSVFYILMFRVRVKEYEA